MSVEDNNKDEGFFSSVGNFLGDTAESIAGNKFVKGFNDYNPIVHVADNAIDYYTGDDEQKEEVINKIDNTFGGYGSQIKSIFSDEDNVELTKEENTHINKIKGFEDLSENVFGTVGFYDQGPEYIQGNQEQLIKELSDYDDTEIRQRYSELNKDTLKDLNAKVQKEKNRIIKEKIKSEIEKGELSGDRTSMDRRKFELEDLVLKEAELLFKDEFDKLNAEYTSYVNIEQDKIISKYIKPEEGKTSLETYQNQFSRNKSQRIEQYIRNNIVKPQMDEIIAEVDWDVNVTNGKKMIDLMQREMGDKLLRDYKHLYENIAIAKTSAQKAKMKGLLIGQLEARKKLFKNQILEYSKLLSEGRKDEYFKFDDLEDEAFTKAYQKLSKDEREYLLKRDGADTAAAMLHDSIEFRKRVQQTTSSLADGDLADSGKYFTLAVGNVLQEVLHGIGTGLGAGFSGLGSASIKQDDESKIFYDEYELTTVDDNFVQKLLKHTLYNVDDLGEVIGTMVVGNKANPVAKGADKLIKGIDFLKKSTKGTGMVAPVFKRNSVKGLTTGGFKTIGYGAKGISESLVGSAIVDKNLRVADTDYNAWVNVVSDAFFEPVTRVFGKGIAKGAASDAVGAGTSYLKTNDFAAGLYKMFTGESTIADTVSEIVRREGISRGEAYKRVKQASDIIFASTDVRANRAYKDNSKLLADATQKYMSQLKENSKAGANKMLTDEGNIITLKDMGYFNNEANNKIDRIFDKINSKDAFEKQLGLKELEDYKNLIKSTLNGKGQIADGRILLDKKILSEKNTKFDKDLKKISGKKDQRDLMKNVLTELLSIRQSVANKAGRLKEKIELFDFMGLNRYTIDVDSLNELGISDPAKYQELITTGKIKIDEGAAKTLGIKEGEYKQQSSRKDSMFKQLKDFDKRTFESIVNGLTGSNANRAGEGYSMTAPKGMTDEEFVDGLKRFFGEDIGISELPKDVKGRGEIAEEVLKQDALISVKSGKVGERIQYYIGVGSKIKDFGFKLRYEDYSSYNKESSNILKDILTQNNIDEGLQHALPIHNINSGLNFTNDYMDSFIEDTLMNFKKEGEYGEIINGKIELNEKGEKISQFIKQEFQKTDIDNNAMTKYVFEVFTLRMLDNFDLYQKVFADINKIKDGAEGSDLINTIEDINTFITSFSGESKIKGGSREFTKQFNKASFKKEAGKIFNDRKKRALDLLEQNKNRLSELESKIVLEGEAKIINIQKNNVLQEIERLEKILKDKKVDFVKHKTDNIFEKTFETYIKNHFLSKLGVLDGPIKKYRESSAMKNTTDEISNIDKKIESNGVTRTEVIRDEIAKIKAEDKIKKQNILDGKPIQENDLTESAELLKELKKELEYMRNRKDISGDKKKLEELESRKAKLQQELNVIASRFEANKVALERDFGGILPNKKNITLAEVMKIIEKNKGKFTDEKFTDYFFHKLQDHMNGNTDYYTEDAVRFVRQEALQKNVFNYIGNRREFSDSLIENPVEKMFSRALTGAKSTELELGDKVFENFSKKYGGKKSTNLNELYFESDIFREKIKGLQATSKDGIGKKTQWSKKIRSKVELEYERIEKDFRELLKEGIGDIKLELMDKGNTKVDLNKGVAFLLGKGGVYETLLGRFKALNYNEKVQSLKIHDIGEGNKKDFRAVLGTGVEPETILTTYLTKKDTNFRVLHIPGIGNLKHLVVGKDDLKLSKIINKLDDSKKKTKLGYEADADGYKLILGAINGTKLNPSIDVGTLRKSLGLDDNEFLMGTYGDKESYLQIYKGDNFDDAVLKYYKFYTQEGGFKKGDEIYKPNDIAKRESPLASVNNIFEEIDIKTETLVLESVFEDVSKSQFLIINNKLNPPKDPITGKRPEPEAVTEEDWNILYEQLNDFDGFDSKYVVDMDDTQKLAYFKKAYFTDGEDGTSFIGNDLAEIHDIITTGTTMFDGIKKDKAKKTHATDTIDGDRYEGKTLFNRASIKAEDGADLNRHVLIGEESVKLGDYDTKDYPKIIRIDGRKYTAKGIIKGTSTLDLKNAKGDTYTTKEEYGISRQVLNIMSYDLKNAYTTEIKNEMDAFIKKELSTIGDFDESISVFGPEGEWLRELNKLHNLGGTTDLVVNGKIKAIYDGVQKIIDKQSLPSSNPTIKKSMIRVGSRKLKRNEAIISRKGKVFKQLKKTLDSEKKRLDDILEKGETISSDEKDALAFINYQIDNEKYFITNFRNPVPSRENLGVYQVVFADAQGVGLNTKIESRNFVKSNDIIMHPESTYVKMEGDHDGDTLVAVPLASVKSMILAKSGLQYKATDDLFGPLKDGSFENKIASVEQIETKKPKDVEKTDLELAKDLVNARTKNVEAKVSVGLVASTTKVLNIFRQIIEELSDISSDKKLNPLQKANLQNEILNKKINGVDYSGDKKEEVTRTLGDVIAKLSEYKGSTKKDALVFDSTYSGKSGSANQLVLDFAKSAAEEFPKEGWIDALMKATGTNTDEGKRFFYNEVVSPLAMTLAKPLDKISIAGMGTAIYKKVPGKKHPEFDDSFEFLQDTLGYQRDLLQHFFGDHSRILYSLQQNISQEFLIKNSIDEGVTLRLDEILGGDLFKNKFQQMKLEQYISRDRADEVGSLFDSARKKDKGLDSRLKVIDDLLKKYEDPDSLKIDFDKATKDFMELKMDRIDRLEAGLYILRHKKNKLFNILEEGEKIDYLNYTTFKRTTAKYDEMTAKGPLQMYNTTYNPSVIFKANANKGTTVLKEEFSRKKKDLINEIADIDNKIKFNNIIDENISAGGIVDKEAMLRSVINTLEKDIKISESTDNLKDDALLSYNQSRVDVLQKELEELEKSKDAKTSDIMPEMLESIDEIGEMTPTEAFEFKGTVKGEVNEAEETSNELIKYLEDYKNYSDLEEPKPKYEKATKEFEDVNEYMQGVDIFYEFKGKELKELNTDIKIVNDVDKLLKHGMNLKLSDELYALDEESINVMNTARELHSKEAYVTKEKYVKLLTELDKDLKKAGLDKEFSSSMYKTYDDLALVNMKYREGYTFDSESFLKTLEKRLEKNKAFENYTDTQKKIIKEKAEGFILIYESIAKGFDEMDKYYKESGGYDITGYSKQFAPSFVSDSLGSFTGDLQFEFRRRGIVTHHADKDPNARHKAMEKDFVDYMRDQAKDSGYKFSDKRARQIFNFVYQREESGILRFIKEGQGAYYALSYQLPSLMLGGMGHVAALMQIVGNGIELASYGKLNKLTKKESTELIEYFKLFGEDTSAQGQGAEPYLAKTLTGKTQAVASKFIKEKMDGVVGEALKKLDLPNDKMSRNAVKNTIDTLITEPLLAVDMINDAARRRASVNHVMRAYGFDNAKQMKAFSEESVRNKDQMKALFYRKYNEIGGGVISTSPIYRETFFTTAESMAGKLFQTSYRLLNGWSLHKLATMADKVISIKQAYSLIRQGDVNGAKVVLKEFSDYMTAQMINVGIAAGIAMKFEKHDYSQDDETQSKFAHISAMTNNITALEILFDRELSQIEAGKSFDLEVQAGATMLGLLKHMTRWLGANPIKIFRGALDRQEVMDEGFMTALYESTQGAVSSYMRTRHGFQLGSIYDDKMGEENISMLGFIVPTRFEESLKDISKIKKAVAVQEAGTIQGVFDIFSSYLKPTYFGNDALRKMSEEILEDDYIRNLSEYGISRSGYDLNKLLLDDDGQLNQKNLTDMYSYLVSYKGVGELFDDKGRKILDSKSYNSKYDDIITNLLKDVGYTKDDFVNNTATRHEGLAKLMMEMDQQNIPELKTQHIVAWLGNEMYSNNVKEITAKYKDLPYAERLVKNDKNLAKYKTLMQMMDQGLLNLNKDNFSSVLNMHVDNFHQDKMKSLNKIKQGQAFKDYMNGLVIANQNLKAGDTSAMYLNTRFSRALKGIASVYAGGEKLELSEQSVNALTDAGLKLLYVVENSTQPLLEKTAKKASILYGMNKAGWDMFRDDKVFNYLTKDSQRLLTSWLYKTNSDIIDMDSESVSNYTDKTGKGKSKYSNYFNKGQGKSGFGGGSRPGFSKQYPDLGKYLRGKEVPTSYENIAKNFSPAPRYMLNDLQFPLIKKINAHVMQELFRASVGEAQAKVKIKTKKGKAKEGYIKKKKTRVPIPKIKKPPRSRKPKTYNRQSTIKGLPGEIIR